MTISQNESGRAFEYGLAVSFSNQLPAKIEDNLTIRRAKHSFDKCSLLEQGNIVKAANEASLFLIAHENRLAEQDCLVKLQSDQLGRYGDVRDIVVFNSEIKEEIGISAKHRHYAVKHSRLSDELFIIEMESVYDNASDGLSHDYQTLVDSYRRLATQFIELSNLYRNNKIIEWPPKDENNKQ